MLMIEARRWRHCTIKSALSKALKAFFVEGMFLIKVSILLIADLLAGESNEDILEGDRPPARDRFDVWIVIIMLY